MVTGATGRRSLPARLKKHQWCRVTDQRVDGDGDEGEGGSG